ncbi:MAG: hypothetical protein HKP58_00240 [Desulfatitalea sp.]|nr:ATP synthase subunit I [Desulfatitalea sp.]NNJ98818.1 hypothetical protein [Desulfatitalea sp.]
MESDLGRLQKRICSKALIIAIIVASAGMALGAKPIAKGFLLGALFSILNFTLMALSLPLRLNFGPRQTFVRCLGSIWCRYLVLAVPLVLATQTAMFDFFAAAVGIFTVQGVILFDQCSRRITGNQ